MVVLPVDRLDVICFVVGRVRLVIGGLIIDWVVGVVTLAVDGVDLVGTEDMVIVEDVDFISVVEAIDCFVLLDEDLGVCGDVVVIDGDWVVTER